jgi:hypothetical protein
VNSKISAIKTALVSTALTLVLVSAVALPSYSEGPMVPAPKLPPPPSASVQSDGTIIYPDGCILYPNGTYVYPDGATGQIEI